MQIPRLRNAVILRNLLIPSNSKSTQNAASFHSTPILCDKWKSKWNFQDGNREQTPSKSHIRYVTRQKRADAKKALKDLLYRSGSISKPFQNKESTWSFFEEEDSGGCDKKRGPKSSSPRSAGKSHNKKTKRKFRREGFTEGFDEQPERVFEATYGNRFYTWSFNSWQESSSRNSTEGFEWRDNYSKWKKRSKDRDDDSSASEMETDDDSCDVFIGSSSERTVLDLPPKGPLKIEDVKTAFRLSALKWHPDKHQGTSQAMAEEKFKLCVNAYKSLCNALSPPA